MTHDHIKLASTVALTARLGELDNGAPATDPREWFYVERELDARYFANHPDARVRQGTGAE